jgi:hypothetical protein
MSVKPQLRELSFLLKSNIKREKGISMLRKADDGLPSSLVKSVNHLMQEYGKERENLRCL